MQVDFLQLQMNTLRRYKRHYKLQLKPGTNKIQLVEVLNATVVGGRNIWLLSLDKVSSEFDAPHSIIIIQFNVSSMPDVSHSLLEQDHVSDVAHGMPGILIICRVVLSTFGRGTESH